MLITPGRVPDATSIPEPAQRFPQQANRTPTERDTVSTTPPLPTDPDRTPSTEHGSRRDLLLGGAAIVGGLAGTQPLSSAPAPSESRSKWDHEYTFGHSKLFMDQYHEGILGILSKIAGETELVGELTSRAARVVRGDHTVWTAMADGHMPHAEQRADREGSPKIMKDEQGLKHLKAGDMLFTNYCNKQVLAVRERGVYVVAVTVSYRDNEFRPAGFTDESHSNPDGLKLKDVSNVILHSHTPYTQGLVRAPEIPEFTLCPSSQTGLGALHWMLNAELANKLENPGAKPVEKSVEYLETLVARIRQIATHRDQIRETAVEMTRRIRRGGRWFVRSREHPGLSSEMEHVASGPMIVNWGNWSAKPRENVMLVSTITPSNPDEVGIANQAQKEGALVIGIGPTTLDGKTPRNGLVSHCQFHFDNFSPESRGVIGIPGRVQPICPTTGLTTNVIQQMLCAQWVDEMVRRGSVPYFFQGGYQQGGSEYNAAMRIHFERQGF
ncbi:MAG: hypothetical protein CMJ59_05715 [Planctomycetaceae bacterium]|nr:hypothetical protein [Planctomycetaceae bacterium]